MVVRGTILLILDYLESVQAPLPEEAEEEALRPCDPPPSWLLC